MAYIEGSSHISSEILKFVGKFCNPSANSIAYEDFTSVLKIGDTKWLLCITGYFWTSGQKYLLLNPQILKSKSQIGPEFASDLVTYTVLFIIYRTITTRTSIWSHHILKLKFRQVAQHFLGGTIPTVTHAGYGPALVRFHVAKPPGNYYDLDISKVYN